MCNTSKLFHTYLVKRKKERTEGRKEEEEEEEEEEETRRRISRNTLISYFRLNDAILLCVVSFIK